MNELFKKAALFHAELLSIAAEKVKDVADDFVRKGILEDQNARRFVLDVREKLDNVEGEVEARLSKMGKVGQDLLANLKIGQKPAEAPEHVDSRIDELEKQLDELRSRKEAIKIRNGKKADFPRKDETLV